MIPEIDELMHRKIQADEPGAAVAVVNDGEVIHRQGYGLANLEWQIPIEPDTVFRLASITKQFTATAIMMLVEANKLSVDDPITKYLPDYPTSGHDIRIHHLLNHTSGIKSYTSIENWFPKQIVHDMTPQELCDSFTHIPFDFKPGERYLYNNSGYHLLGMIIEKIGGESYQHFIQQQIFEPLGMAHSYYLSNEPIIPRRASGYSRNEIGFHNAAYVSMTQPYAAGSLGSTVDDLVLWANAINKNRLISPETQTLMWTQTTPVAEGTVAYGYGWLVSDYRDYALAHHGGGINGYVTYIAQFRHQPVTIIILANREDLELGPCTLTIARHVLGLSTIVRTPISLSSSDQDRVAGKYLIDNQWPVEIIRDSDDLFLKLEKLEKILPMSQTAFYLESDSETELHFSQEENGFFHKCLRVNPLSPFKAIRIVDEEETADTK